MNVILIVNDTFRRDHLGCYGNPWIKTPNLDAFAKESAVFDQYYIGSYPTVPNRWDMAVGKFGFPYRGWRPLDPGDTTVAQRLAQKGVHTQMIWDTPMLGNNDYNYTRGFKGFEFIHAQKGDPWRTSPNLPIRFKAQPHKIKNIPSMANYLRNHYGRRYEHEYCAPRTMSAAMEWLQMNYNHDSFFLYVDMWDPHEPFDAPWYDYQLYADPNFDGDQLMYPPYGRYTYMTEAEHENVKALYAASVTLTDRWVGQFLGMAERLGLFKNTLIMWTTDHGHLFGEHDLHGKPGSEMGKLYEVTTRIPLLVRHPDGAGAGKRITGIVQPPDITASILDFMDAPVPETLDGQSFMPMISGETTTGREFAFSNRYPQVEGTAGLAFDGWVGSDRIVQPATITTDEWALICAPQGLPWELYNIQADPEQLNDLMGSHPDVANKLYHAWLDFMEAHGAPEERIRPWIDGKTEVTVQPDDLVYAFKDDMDQWIAYPSEEEALAHAYREDAPGGPREVKTMTFSQLADDNPKNLVHLLAQYYWVEDLV